LPLFSSYPATKNIFQPARALSSFSSNCSCFNARGAAGGGKEKAEGMSEREREKIAGGGFVLFRFTRQQKRERRKLLKESSYALRSLQPLVK
jgi:hypothetical protein